MSNREDGATAAEQLLDSARRNNEDLFDSVCAQLGGDLDKLTALINESRDPLGNTALHLCCQYGSWEVLDKILDIPGDIELDPVNPQLDNNTPLHCAVSYSIEEPEHGTFIVSNLIQVGADPRVKNALNQKPIDLVHGDELDELVDILQGAELALERSHNTVQEVEDDDDEDEE